MILTEEAKNAFIMPFIAAMSEAAGKKMWEGSVGNYLNGRSRPGVEFQELLLLSDGLEILPYFFSGNNYYLFVYHGSDYLMFKNSLYFSSVSKTQPE